MIQPAVKYPLVSVVISAYNQHDNLIKILAALEKQTFKDFEVIICDNGSQDYSIIEELEKFPHFSRYVWQQHKGFWNTKNLNNGIRIADGKWILDLGGDVILSHDKVLENYVNLADENKVIIGGRCEDRYKEGMEVMYNTMPGCNFFFSKKKFIEIGMWDERHKWFGGDDYELYLRFQKMGNCKLYAHYSCCGNHIDHPASKADKHSFDILLETEQKFGIKR